MSKFKVGDTVRCVHHWFDPQLIAGKEYTVQEVEDGGQLVRLTSDMNAQWLSNRFELVTPKPEPKFKVGDTVRWVLGSDFLTMTRCKEYTVTNTFEFDNDKQNLLVVNDHGNDASWSCGFFELVTPKPEPKANPTYTVTWEVPAIDGYQSLIDGELSFGTEEEADGFAQLFKERVQTTVTKD
jgi:hypothetical protein